MEHRVALPQGFKYINQFAPSVYDQKPGKMGCGPSSLSMADQFAYPHRDNPDQLLVNLYTKYIGLDNPDDPNGITDTNLEAALHALGIGFVNMQSLVNEFQAGNRAPLHAELMAQNNQDVPQILVVTDESQLYDDSNPPKKLHNWADGGMHHVMFRVGYSDDLGYGLYMEPAAPGFPQPVHIPWDRIVNAGLMHCWAIMPQGVSAPPPGFLFQNGTWPVPKPVVEHEAALNALHILEQAIETSAKAAAALQEALNAK